MNNSIYTKGPIKAYIETKDGWYDIDLLGCQIDYQPDIEYTTFGDSTAAVVPYKQTYTLTGKFNTMTYTQSSNTMPAISSKEVDMTNPDAIRREAIKLLEVADHLDSRPEDTFKTGAIV